MVEPPSGDGEASPRFGRLLVVKSMGRSEESVGRAFDNLFAVHAMLEQQGANAADLRTIALPALGGGDQMLSPELIVDSLSMRSMSESS